MNSFNRLLDHKITNDNLPDHLESEMQHGHHVSLSTFVSFQSKSRSENPVDTNLGRPDLQARSRNSVILFQKNYLLLHQLIKKNMDRTFKFFSILSTFGEGLFNRLFIRDQNFQLYFMVIT